MAPGIDIAENLVRRCHANAHHLCRIREAVVRHRSSEFRREADGIEIGASDAEGGGVNPWAETRKLGTGYHSLTIRWQQSSPSTYWRRLVKRRRALLESNPPRNSQPGNSSRTMRRARSSSRRVFVLGPGADQREAEPRPRL